MLNGTFFTYSNLHADGDILTADITLNPAHEIFQGHFPGQPIVPGVCMVQMIKEVLEGYLLRNTKLVNADAIKFLSFIDPNVHAGITMHLKLTRAGQETKVDAQLMNDETKFLKFKGSFI
jgi:3-hydroxyacyl-[acyl-carrier-protein] dehydratase